MVERVGWSCVRVRRGVVGEGVGGGGEGTEREGGEMEVETIRGAHRGL